MGAGVANGRNLIAQVGGMDDLSDSDGEDMQNILNGNSAINNDSSPKSNCARFLLTNARSLTPKIDSLIDAFRLLSLHFACVTETWYQGDHAQEPLVLYCISRGRLYVQVQGQMRKGPCNNSAP